MVKCKICEMEFKTNFNSSRESRPILCIWKIGKRLYTQEKLESLGYTVFVIWERDSLDVIKEKLYKLDLFR